MRVVVWIVEGRWEPCVDAASRLDADATITLVHVAAQEVEHVVQSAREALLGRRRRDPEVAPEAISTEEAQAILHEARARLGRDAALQARRGRPEQEVIEAARDADLLVLARDGSAGTGPRSLGRAGRFVVDHAPCPLLLVPGTAGPPPAPPGGGRGPEGPPRPAPPLPSGGR